jgi:hypothetical protein
VELGLNGVRLGRPVVVLIASAGGIDADGILAPNSVLRHATLPIVDERAAAVVDSGTGSGVMRAVGRAGISSSPRGDRRSHWLTAEGWGSTALQQLRATPTGSSSRPTSLVPIQHIDAVRAAVEAALT